MHWRECIEEKTFKLCHLCSMAVWQLWWLFQQQMKGNPPFVQLPWCYLTKHFHLALHRYSNNAKKLNTVFCTDMRNYLQTEFFICLLYFYIILRWAVQMFCQCSSDWYAFNWDAMMTKAKTQGGMSHSLCNEKLWVSLGCFFFMGLLKIVSL